MHGIIRQIDAHLVHVGVNQRWHFIHGSMIYRQVTRTFPPIFLGALRLSAGLYAIIPLELTNTRYNPDIPDSCSNAVYATSLNIIKGTNLLYKFHLTIYTIHT